MLRHAPRNSVGAEIGVFTGMFSDVLASEIPSKRIYLIDPWSKLHGSHFPNWGRYTAQVALATAAAKEAAIWRAESADSECVVVEDFGINWLKGHNDAFLGWVYLDANHTFDAVLEDLHEIGRCLLPGGTIMGDDMWIHQDGKVSDVFFAVKAFCQTAGFDIIHMDQNGQWAIRRTDCIISHASQKQQTYFLKQ